MPTFGERERSRQAEISPTSSRESTIFIVNGATNGAEALAYVMANTGTATTDAMGRTLYRGTLRADEIVTADTPYWDVAVEWGPIEFAPKPVGTVRISYDTGGATALQVYPMGGTNRVYGLSGSTGASLPVIPMIGDQGDGTVDGVDVRTREFKLRATVTFDEDNLPDPQALYELTGKVNDATVTVTDTYTDEALTFEAGEMLFLGASRSESTPQGTVDFAYEFSCSPNVTNLQIRSGTSSSYIDIDRKGGHEYIWTQNVRVTSPAAGGSNAVLVNMVKHAIVSPVYFSGDFTVLEIPA